MPTSAVIKIEQISGISSIGDVQDALLYVDSEGTLQDSTFSLDTDLTVFHLYHVSNPVARPVATGWGTENEDDWSDSPARQPSLLYRHRFGWGRDDNELFGDNPLSPGADGEQFGNLDANSGQLIYDRLFSISAEGSVFQFEVNSWGVLQELDVSKSSTAEVKEIGGLDADVTVQQYPFVTTALPEPYSYRNPIDTNVYLRLANFAFPISSGTITMYIDEVLRTPIQVVPFFGGLGGFDVTWVNNQLFDYDATVNVHVEFYDTDSPPNKTTIKYPFYTVPDLAPPRVLNLVPADGSLNIPTTGPIQFDLTDYEGLVDMSTLTVFVNNVKVVSAGQAVVGTLTVTELENDGGFTVEYAPDEPWLYGDLIPVSIFVKDDAPTANELFFSYSFTTEESLSPRLINLRPQSCALAVPTRTNILADVIDGGHGLDPNSIVFTVEEIERGNTITLIPIVHRDE